MDPVFSNSGQRFCYDETGDPVPCPGSGQDAEFGPGRPWPRPRFHLDGELVTDRLTGLVWPRNANLNEFPLTWQEALDFVAGLNREKALGHGDWRLPNRRELRSLMSYQTRKPALPEGHPFTAVFLGWYWTSTTAAINPAYAWYVHLEGARMFYGRKDQYYLVWPVRGATDSFPATGQKQCFDPAGRRVPCRGTGQDGEMQVGVPWPEPRFVVERDQVGDRLTGLAWLKRADLTGGPVSWQEALDAVARLNAAECGAAVAWRLPTVNELESLVDCSAHDPALPADHPFESVRDGYWSATTSCFEPDWAWALYLNKGAIGVGVKRGAHFYVWPVRAGRTAGCPDKQSMPPVSGWPGGSPGCADHGG